MNFHREILRDAITASGMSHRELAGKAGINNSVLSKFLNGKQDMMCATYFSVLEALPEPQRLLVKQKLAAGNQLNLETLLINASIEERAVVMRIIADYWFSNQLIEKSEKLAVA
ncbi:MAG: helix-turn-helix transcriptional regulator [Richelia sp. RM2_1_2]|nr:helix-turn-helix transcriptional regulator [Richelia sp. RM2_1_2]